MSQKHIPGAHLAADGSCHFVVWAPVLEGIQLLLTETERIIEMERDADGYYHAHVHQIKAGTKYMFKPEGRDPIPDPASGFQPDGVHSASAVVDHNTFEWTDNHWRGIPFQDLILYELHVGTFTPQGTFDAVIERLDDLVDTGINAIQLLPVSQFPGNRNWGYDGVYPYAVQNSYGGPEGLKRLVNACHAKGVAVLLDVVYNHIGPEGNYFADYGPYFTDQYNTPWGDALNFDGDWSDGVREYFCGNALYWFSHFHLDGLRLDAVHMVFDQGAVNFWQYANDRVAALQRELGRPLYMIAESDLNSPRTVAPTSMFGLGFSAQWLDDFHHALYVLLDENGRSRYEDFGQIEQLAKAYKEGFVHSGEYVSFRKRRHGASSAAVGGDRFVVFNLNHDQVGNRPHGERLCMLVDTERLKLAAAAMLLSPYVPMLFMGEEYADESPFFYFVSHSDPELIEAVRKGRAEEFKAFNTAGEMPDPQSEDTFRQSIINWNKRSEPKQDLILRWHRTLIAMRRSTPALRSFDKNNIHAATLGTSVLLLHRQTAGGREHLLAVFNFSDAEQMVQLPSYTSDWKSILESRGREWTLEGQHYSIKGGAAGEQIALPPVSVIVFEGGRSI